jgi:hypothetical protein
VCAWVIVNCRFQSLRCAAQLFFSSQYTVVIKHTFLLHCTFNALCGKFYSHVLWLKLIFYCFFHTNYVPEENMFWDSRKIEQNVEAYKAEFKATFCLMSIFPFSCNADYPLMSLLFFFGKFLPFSISVFAEKVFTFSLHSLHKAVKFYQIKIE